MTRAVFQLHVPDGDEVPTPVEVTVTGEVDASNVREFTRSVQDVPGARPVILQLSSVKYLDSAGFAALDRLLAENAIVIVLSPDSFMYRVAKLMCMPIHDDVEAARRALRTAKARSLLRLFDGLTELLEELVVVVTGQEVTRGDDHARPASR